MKNADSGAEEQKERNQEDEEIREMGTLDLNKKDGKHRNPDPIRAQMCAGDARLFLQLVQKDSKGQAAEADLQHGQIRKAHGHRLVRAKQRQERKRTG